MSTGPCCLSRTLARQAYLRLPGIFWLPMLALLALLALLLMMLTLILTRQCHGRSRSSLIVDGGDSMHGVICGLEDLRW